MSDAVRPRTTGDFEVDRRRHLDAFSARLPEQAERLTWPLERLHALRDERLRAVLHTAKDRSPWHAQRLADVDPASVSGADLSALPTMTKADAMANWDAIVTDTRLTLAVADAHLETVVASGPAYMLGEYMVVATGGSSGARGVFVWDHEGWLEYGLVRERPSFWLQQHAGWTRSPRRAFVAAQHPTHATALLGQTFSGSPQLGPTRSFPVSLPIAEIVAGLNEYQPTYLFAYASTMRRLADEAEAGRLRVEPDELVCAAEPLTRHARAHVEQIFGRPLVNIYAATEPGNIARSYPGSPGLHLNEDVAVFEPVDAANRPVPPGTRAAKMLVTNVINHVFPLIRYELTDEVTMLAEPNPGPWTGRRIADIEGRLDDHFAYPGGIEVHPHVFRSALGRRREIVEYQVRQTRDGASIDVCTSAHLDVASLERELADGLARLGVASAEISVAVVDRIEPAVSTGKTRRFIPLSSPERP